MRPAFAGWRTNAGPPRILPNPGEETKLKTGAVRYPLIECIALGVSVSGFKKTRFSPGGAI
jgi:hypothetical protein